jgi:Holliday junction resolvase RusA-like endonuclease
MRNREPLLGPLSVSVTAFMPVPPSWSNRKRDAALAGTVRPTGKPDSDNVQKVAWDALNSIVFADDAQIVEAKVSKIYDERPRLRVEVAPLEVFAEEDALGIVLRRVSSG